MKRSRPRASLLQGVCLLLLAVMTDPSAQAEAAASLTMRRALQDTTAAPAPSSSPPLSSAPAPASTSSPTTSPALTTSPPSSSPSPPSSSPTTAPAKAPTSPTPAPGGAKSPSPSPSATDEAGKTPASSPQVPPSLSLPTPPKSSGVTVPPASSVTDAVSNLLPDEIPKGESIPSAVKGIPIPPVPSEPSSDLDCSDCELNVDGAGTTKGSASQIIGMTPVAFWLMIGGIVLGLSVSAGMLIMFYRRQGGEGADDFKRKSMEFVSTYHAQGFNAHITPKDYDTPSGPVRGYGGDQRGFGVGGTSDLDSRIAYLKQRNDDMEGGSRDHPIAPLMKQSSNISSGGFVHQENTQAPGFMPLSSVRASAFMGKSVPYVEDDDGRQAAGRTSAAQTEIDIDDPVPLHQPQAYNRQGEGSRATSVFHF